MGARVDALELLKADHDLMRELFDQFKEAKEADDAARLDELQSTIFAELEAHTGVEEEIFYPEAKEVGGEAEELINEGVEEHHVVKVLMGEIEDLSPDDDAFKAKMTVLIENVEHHAEEEEEELFPKLRKAFGKERLEAMGEKMKAAKERRLPGSTPGVNPDSYSREELYDKATEQGVEGRSQMSKDELAENVRDGS